MLLYRVSIKSSPDYKHLLQENYIEYKHIFLTLLKLASKKTSWITIIDKHQHMHFFTFNTISV